MTALRRLIAVAALAATVLAVVAAHASANTFEVKQVIASRSTTQAGAHPNLSIAVNFCDPPFENPTEGCQPNSKLHPDGHERLRNMNIGTPPGMLGNVLNTPYCEYGEYLLRICPPESQIGMADGYAVLPTLPIKRTLGKIYNVRPFAGEAGRFGAVILPNNSEENVYVWQPTAFSVRTAGDFGLDASNPDFFNELPFGPNAFPVKVRQAAFTLCGYGVDPATYGMFPNQQQCKVGGTPFLTNPTSCRPDAKIDVSASSWEHPNDYVSNSTPFITTGCTSPGVPFDPTIDVSVDDDRAGKPAGYTVGVNQPNTELDPIHGAALKDAVVKMPVGVRLNPVAAHELEGCSEAQFGVGNDKPDTCPADSRVGEASVETPALDGDPSTQGAIDPLVGKVYFASPTAADKWRIFVTLNGGGVRVKLEGKIELNASTGQVTTRFLDSPETPFTRFELKLRGGDHGVLLNPPTCGDYSLDATFSPWSGGPDVHPTNPERSFTISGDCPSGTRPFNPALTASTNPTQAAAPTKAKLQFDRPDGDQLVKRLDISMPPGLVGSLAKLPLCPKAIASAGDCGDDSQIGSLKVDVGAGGSPIQVPGKLFLAEPVAAGDVASLAAVIPGKVGPIDLGNVVVFNHVKLRKSDSGLDVTSDDFPTSLQGIPIEVRKIAIDVDRDGFLQNPSSCAAATVAVDFTSDQDSVAHTSSTDAPTGCDSVPFSPSLRMIAGGNGQRGRFEHPSLRAIVTQAPGESAIKTATVLLPDVLRPDTVTLNKPGVLCTDAQFAANGCPPGSRIGTATVYTPLLPQPLTGPVLIVQKIGNILPKLEVMLSGAVSLQLEAQNEIQGVRTVNKFAGLPDVPQSRFELNIDGGNGGILKNFTSLCTAKNQVADATFTGHSGASSSDHPKLEVEGCDAQAKDRARVAAKRAKVSKRGVVKIKVQCTDDEADCSGKLTLRAGRRIGAKKFAVPAGEAKSVPVRLDRKALKRLQKKRKLSATVTLTVDGSSARTKLTLNR